jgi:hypothetical protein
LADADVDVDRSEPPVVVSDDEDEDDWDLSIEEVVVRLVEEEPTAAKKGAKPAKEAGQYNQMRSL